MDEGMDGLRWRVDVDGGGVEESGLVFGYGREERKWRRDGEWRLR